MFYCIFLNQLSLTRSKLYERKKNKLISQDKNNETKILAHSL